MTALNIKQYVPKSVKNCIRLIKSLILQMPTNGRVRRLIRANSIIWLDIGSGSRRGDGGWICLDLNPACDLCWDLRRGLPFPDNSIERIYSSHTLEHFSPNEAQTLLLECNRVLITGGVLRVSVPDARILIGAYISKVPFDSRKYMNGYQIPCPYGRLDLLNFIAYMNGTHKYLFDDENLLNVLRAADFRNVQLSSFDPKIDDPVRQHESLYAHCYK